MTGAKFESVNRFGEVFEGDSPAEARRNRIAAARADLAARHAADPDAVRQFEARKANLTAARKREQQRVQHLVLGGKRPVERVTEGKKKGRRRPKLVDRPVTLAPGIEEAVQVRESWSHKAYGTPETWERAMNSHDGALAQLHRNGTIDKDQLEWAAQIANVYRSLEADVAIKVASFEARVDESRHGGQVAEGVYRVRMHLAYGYWRRMLPAPKRLVLDMIVGDHVGYTIAARRHRVHNRKARRLLIEAINRWPRCVAHAFSTVDRSTVDAVNAGRVVDPIWLNPEPSPSSLRAAQAALERLGDGDVATQPMWLPPINPDFLDDHGHLKEWSEIATIIRAGYGQQDDEAA